MTPTQARVLERTAASPRAGEAGALRDPGRASCRGLRQIPGRQLAAGTLAVIRRQWLAVLFGLSAIFAAVTALVSINPPERLWGELAAVSYAVSAVIAAAGRRRGAALAVLVSLAGALLAPLAWMALSRLGQPEVYVIIRSAKMLVHTGTPYASPAALAAAHTWMAYDPYLPALVVFGVPRVLGGGLLTDPRVWFGAAFLITFGAALRVARVPRPAWWTILVTVSPVVALPLAVGGDDLPVLGLVCLGLALANRATAGRWPWPVAAGLALGMAAAMKATAWPALVVVLILLARRGGWRAVGWFTAAVAGLVVVTDGPVVAANPAATVANTVLYPLGLTKVVSPAASQLPGHMLAGLGTWGHWAALALMVAAGAGVAASLIIRPPKGAQAAGWRLVVGLTLLFGLAPASRVGYFVYPLGLAAWLLLHMAGSGHPGADGGGGAAGQPEDTAGQSRERSVDPVPAYGRAGVTHGHD
jgi:Glycosyltransferase family 87